jgi:predicted RNA-binding protein associated with RNAse of E/G family
MRYVLASVTHIFPHDLYIYILTSSFTPQIGLPTSDIDLDVEQLTRVACALLDIPVYDNIIESLHLLVSLYLECSANKQIENDGK